MAVSSTTSSSQSNQTIRNRLHQRTHRARRQQYIKELEEKVQKYELATVEATVQVQNSARFVLEENAALRRLLREKGVAEEEIDEYLSSTRDRVTRLSGTVSAIKGQDELPDQETPLRDAAMTPALRTTKNRVRLTCVLPQEGAQDGGNIYNNQPDTMDCYEAAAIITGIRTASTVADVRQELGCGTQGQCSVQNAEVFQALSETIWSKVSPIASDIATRNRTFEYSPRVWQICGGNSRVWWLAFPFRQVGEKTKTKDLLYAACMAKGRLPCHKDPNQRLGVDAEEIVLQMMSSQHVEGGRAKPWLRHDCGRWCLLVCLLDAEAETEDFGQ
jgi:hypothetical protein